MGKPAPHQLLLESFQKKVKCKGWRGDQGFEKEEVGFMPSLGAKKARLFGAAVAYTSSIILASFLQVSRSTSASSLFHLLLAFAQVCGHPCNLTERSIRPCLSVHDDHEIGMLSFGLLLTCMETRAEAGERRTSMISAVMESYDDDMTDSQILDMTPQRREVQRGEYRRRP